MQVLRRPGLAAEPDEPLDVVGEIGEADLHPRSSHAMWCARPVPSAPSVGQRRVRRPSARPISAHWLAASSPPSAGPAASCDGCARPGHARPARPRSSPSDRPCRPRHRRRCCRRRSPPPAAHRHGPRRGSRSSGGSGRAGDRSRRGSCTQRPARRDRPAARHPRAGGPWRTSPSSARRGPSGAASRASPPSPRGLPGLDGCPLGPVLRCLGAATMVASTICPPIAR